MGGLFTKLITRKWLNVKKKKVFSYNHINDKHKKIDWIIRITLIFLLIIALFINVSSDSLKHIWFLEPHILLLAFGIVSEIVRIIMEKRYSENKNDYILSVIRLVVISIFLISMFSTDFFGLL